MVAVVQTKDEVLAEPLRALDGVTFEQDPEILGRLVATDHAAVRHGHALDLLSDQVARQ